MRKLLFFAVLAFNAAAFAMPKVGDSATYDMVVKTAQYPNGLKIEMVQSLTEKDAAGQNFKYQQVVRANGQEQKTEGVYNISQLATDEKVKQLLDNCEAQGGKLERIAYAGTHLTCKMAQGTSTMWIGQVPFAMVRLATVTADGSQIDVALKSYVFGQ